MKTVQYLLNQRKMNQLISIRRPDNRNKLEEKRNCMKCIQTKVELQRLRAKVNKLVDRLKEKQVEATSLHKVVSYYKSNASMKAAKAEKTEKCIVCKEKLTKEELFTHLCLKDGNELQCQYCTRMFKVTTRLLEHLQIFHDDKQFYDCDRCTRQYEMVELLHIHQKSHTSDLQPKFPCEKCEKTFYLQSRLDQHAKSEHPEQTEDPILKRKFKF